MTMLSSTAAFGGSREFKGNITGVVTPTTIDTHADGHPASLTYSTTAEFLVQEMAENDREAGMACPLPDGSTGRLVVGQPIGGPGIFGWQLWHHRDSGSSLTIKTTKSETCMGESQSITRRAGEIVRGTGDFAGATGTLVQESNVNLLWGGKQAVQPYGADPPYIGYFVSVDGEFELTVHTP
ncbi:MAG: hypothetical protein JRH19_23870 [Deltaproteobacteria bacterium]|nr:hypothetical protein [Deltaproteobacteria bacterium]